MSALRPGSRLVLWGGRPHIDRQVGSGCDRLVVELAATAPLELLPVINDAHRSPAAPHLGRKEAA